MHDAVDALQRGGVEAAGLGVPPDVAGRARRAGDAPNDVSVGDEARGERGADEAGGAGDGEGRHDPNYCVLLTA
jgi:hypothetical protein